MFIFRHFIFTARNILKLLWQRKCVIDEIVLVLGVYTFDYLSKHGGSKAIDIILLQIYLEITKALQCYINGNSLI